MSDSGHSSGEQLTLVVAPPRPRRRASADPPAAVNPVALVQVDTGLAHLDRPFEYAVPTSLAQAAQPGVRVKVRFAGQDLDGFVLERRAHAEHSGRLAPLRKVVSPEPVLQDQVLAAVRAVAASHGATVGDLLRLAVPPRHAAAERALPLDPPGIERTVDVSDVVPGPAWSAYAAGPAFLHHVAEGGAPAAAVLALPSGSEAEAAWPTLVARACVSAVAGGRTALAVVPDHRDVARVEAALTVALGAGRHTRLSADQGPQARYTAFLKALRGHVDVVVGTRAAAWAPLPRLGLVVWWDDGDDLHEEPRFPHAPVREVLLARAAASGSAVLTAGFVRSVAVQALVEDGAMTSVEVPPAVARPLLPRVRVAGEGRDAERDPAAAAAHLPTVAWEAAKKALADGPVLVQVPRRGYLPALACDHCRRPARCPACAGPLALQAPHQPPTCRWCGRGEPIFECPHCQGPRLRSSVVGARRTAEELGRAFPGVPVERSGADVVLASVPAGPRLVVATPGAEPVAEGGYAAVLLLDAWALLDRPVLAAAEEALRRWLGAAALARGAAPVVLCGAPGGATLAVIEALVRWDPVWFARRELAERHELGLPPASTLGIARGPRRTVTDLLAGLRLPPGATVLGPVPGEAPDEWRGVVRVDPTQRNALAREFAAARALSSAGKDPNPPRLRMGAPEPLA